jgi:hypothetical protein
MPQEGGMLWLMWNRLVGALHNRERVSIYCAVMNGSRRVITRIRRAVSA